MKLKLLCCAPFIALGLSIPTLAAPTPTASPTPTPTPSPKAAIGQRATALPATSMPTPGKITKDVPLSGREVRAAKSPTPTPTPPPYKISQVPVKTPTPSPALKKIGSPTPMPKNIGSPTPTPFPRKIGSPTPTPTAFPRKIGSPAPTPATMPKEGLTTGGRPGPINTASPSKKLVPGGINPAPPQPGGGSGPGQKIPDPKIPIVDQDTPVAGTTDTPKEPHGYADKLTSKLAVYTKNGIAVTQTNLSGEFPSKLETTATANKVFTVQWSRDKAGQAEKANLILTKEGVDVPFSTKSVEMPAGTKAMDIEFTIPDTAVVATHRLVLASKSGTSNNVRLFYTGEGGGQLAPVTPPPDPNFGKSAPSAHRVKKAKFTPMSGYPKQAGYTKPQLTLTLESDNVWSISEIFVEVYSGPYKSPEIITASGGSQQSPRRLFVKTWKIPATSYTISPGKPRTIKIDLPNTMKGEPDSPGVENSEDWGLAYGQTTDASFRWSVDGGVSGSVDKPLKQPWNWP